MAPAAFCTSLHVSLRLATDPAVKIDNATNCTSWPLVMAWRRTSCAPSHNTPVTPQNTKAMTMAVMAARVAIRPTDFR